MRDVAGKGSELSGFAAGVKSMTTEQLKAEFAEGLRVTRERFLRLGAVLVELESRGETVEGDKYLIRLLRKIGLGELSVDVVVRFAGRPYTLASIITKSKPEEQDSIMAMTDNEVEEKYVGPRSERGGGKRRHRQHERQGDYGQVAPPSPEEMAANASVGDVAEMCLRIVNAAADPVAVAERLLPRLQEIKQKPRPRKHSFSDE